MMYKEIPTLRTQLWKEQNKNCALCGQLIPEDEIVLDHEHQWGHIRGVLHRGCNALLGHIENNMKRNKIDDIRLGYIMTNLIKYKNNHREEVHPKHTTKLKRTARRKTKK